MVNSMKDTMKDTMKETMNETQIRTIIGLYQTGRANKCVGDALLELTEDYLKADAERDRVEAEQRMDRPGRTH